MSKKYRHLADKAYYTVLKVMEEGSKKYPDDTYMQVPIKTHMEHLRKHIRDYDNMQDIEDLEHALTRMVIVLAKLGVGEDE